MNHTGLLRRAALKLTANTQREGRNILDHGNLAMTGVSRGYLDNMSNTPVCSFQFRGKELSIYFCGP